MTVDVSALIDDIHALGLETVVTASETIADVKREDGSWSTRVVAGINVTAVSQGGDVFTATLTEEDDIGLGEMYDDGPLPAREIVPVNKQALFWEGADHPVKKVNWPGTEKHVGWWSDGLEEQWDAALSAALG